MKNEMQSVFYQRGDSELERAQQIWVILVSHVFARKQRAGSNRLMTYGDLAALLGNELPAVGLGRPLTHLADYCLAKKLPLLHLLVVSKGKGAPGDAVRLPVGQSPEDDQSSQLDAIYGFDWFRCKVPSIRDLSESRLPK